MSFIKLWSLFNCHSRSHSDAVRRCVVLYVQNVMKKYFCEFFVCFVFGTVRVTLTSMNHSSCLLLKPQNLPEVNKKLILHRLTTPPLINIRSFLWFIHLCCQKATTKYHLKNVSNWFLILIARFFKRVSLFRGLLSKCLFGFCFCFVFDAFHMWNGKGAFRRWRLSVCLFIIWADKDSGTWFATLWHPMRLKES